MSIFAWIIFGVIMGVIANSVDPEPAYGGILGAIFLGFTGAFIGGIISLVFTRSEIISGINLETLLIAISGSIVFLMIGRSIRKT